MTLTGIDHCTVVVSDMERAVKFYRDVLGLPEVEIPSTFPGAGLKVRWFKLGGQYIHLFPMPAADPPSPKHVAMHVADVNAARDWFKSRGVETKETVPIPGADRFFIADPDGNRIEIIQWFDLSAIVPVGGDGGKSPAI
ncbi:MAG: VOC family protein [Verrucomicrobia bacterium]|nr:VOC family protein [Verrucomicrobiota bacterium]